MRVSIVTVSDRSASGERDDLSGPVLKELVTREGWSVSSYDIIPDESEQIEKRLLDLADTDGVDLVLTTGGTGFGPRDVTPEATMRIVERHAPGFAEVMRLESMKKTPHGMLSRGVSGIRGATLIVNLPGSPKAVRECFAAIAPALPHAIQLLHGDTDGGHEAKKTE
jgi:molybdenum cofactor synthesis domain-containing protein